MATPEPTRSEIGVRVRRVREMANLSARRLRLALGSTDSNLISDIEDGKKKIVDFLRLRDIAKTCAGRGQLENVEWEDILDYMTCRVDWDIAPRPRQRLAEDDSQLTSTDDDGAMGGKRSRRLALTALRQAA